MSIEHVYRMILTHPENLFESSLDMVQLATQISIAVYKDTGVSLTTKEIDNCVFQVAADEANKESPGVAETGMFVSPSMAFLLYADWMTLLGEMLGHPAHPDGDSIYWMKDHPNLNMLTRALMRISIRCTRAASEAYKEQNGHHMMEVFLEATETGESYEQTQIRLSHKSQGLRRVK